MSPAEEFISDQSNRLKPILKKLHYLIISSSPYVEDRIVFGIPFYYGRKRIFYINPQKQSVDLGFCEGNLLSENPILKTKNRKQVKTKYSTLCDYKNLKDFQKIYRQHLSVLL